MKTEIKYIIGLGNPDPAYQHTRHNIGFMVLDYILKQSKGNLSLDTKINALVANVKIANHSVKLIKPFSYVNKSGEVIKKLKVKKTEFILIHDDLDVPFGNTKLSFAKNSAGHKGVDSVAKSIKSKDFYRLRIGIATTALKKARQQSNQKRDAFVQQFVLSKFTNREVEILKNIFQTAYEKIVQVIKQPPN